MFYVDNYFNDHVHLIWKILFWQQQSFGVDLNTPDK